MPSNPQYQSLPRNDATSPRRGGGGGGGYQGHATQQQHQQQPLQQQYYMRGPSPGASTLTKSTSDSRKRSSGSDYLGDGELGPYSHLQNGSMGTMGGNRKRGYGNSSTESRSDYNPAHQKYNISAAANAHMYNKSQKEPDDYLVSKKRKGERLYLSLLHFECSGSQRAPPFIPFHSLTLSARP